MLRNFLHCNNILSDKKDYIFSILESKPVVFELLIIIFSIKSFHSGKLQVCVCKELHLLSGSI